MSSLNESVTLQFIDDKSRSTEDHQALQARLLDLLVVPVDGRRAVTPQDFASLPFVRGFQFHLQSINVDEIPDFDLNAIPDFDLNALAALMIYSRRHLRCFVLLSSCLIGSDAEIDAFFQACARIKKLKYLYLMNLVFVDNEDEIHLINGWNQLLSTLHSSTLIIRLGVCFWHRGTMFPQGRQVLISSHEHVAALLRSRTLNILALELCDSRTCQAITDHLLQNHVGRTLEQLILTHAAHATGKQIFEALRVNKTLKVLRLVFRSGCPLRELKGGALVAAKALQKNTTLVELRVAHEPPADADLAPDDEVEEALVKLLRQNTTLQMLDWEGFASKECLDPTGSIGMLLEWNKIGRKKLVDNHETLARGEWVDALGWRSSAADTVPWMFHVLQMNPSLCHLPGPPPIQNAVGKRKRTDLGEAKSSV